MSMNQSNNQIIKKNLLIICRGAGDLATASSTDCTGRA